MVKANDVPGLVGAVVAGDRVAALGAAGVRRRGSAAPLEVGDPMHLGSCTKAMTATLCAALVAEERIAWDASVRAAFPGVAQADDGWKAVTLEHLLRNRGGAPATLDADGLWGRLVRSTAAPVEQRAALVAGVLRRAPVAKPGERDVYSNAGFAIAGAMAESAAKAPWEDLLRKRLFGPLGMSSAGFGAPGTAKSLDAPRGHLADGTVVEPGPFADNPAAIGPAGTVHASVPDWAKFASLHLLRGKGAPAGLERLDWDRLHAPVPGGDYAMGWKVVDRPWAGGRALVHSGSNTMWFCTVWLAPARGFAVLVACNQGGDAAAKACDEGVAALLRDHLAPPR